MASAGVVPALDVVEDRAAGGGLRVGQARRCEQLGLDGGEERLGEGVVPALAVAADRQTSRRARLARLAYWADWCTGSRGRSGRSRRPRGGAGWHGVGEGVGDQVGAQVVGGGPADDPAGGEVDDGGQVEPALPGGDVGDVAAPAGVERRGGRVDGEVAADQIGRWRRPGRGSWSAAIAAVLGRAGRRPASAGRPVAGASARPGRAARRGPAGSRRCRATRRGSR